MNAVGIKAIRDELQRVQDNLVVYRKNIRHGEPVSETVKQLERQESELKEALKDVGTA